MSPINMRSLLLVQCLLLTLAFTSPLIARGSSPNYDPSTYAPIYGGQCPPSLVRSASQRIAPDEASYTSARKQNADTSLITWLKAINNASNLGVGSQFSTSGRMPTLALTSSGGGWRALLLGAGLISGLDSRETRGQAAGVSGLWQALTYHSGLSGGSWLVASIAGNGWPAITTLKSIIWESGLDHDLLDPDGDGSATQLAKSLDWVNDVRKAVKAKDDTMEKNQQNGTSLTDWWGRLLSYELFSTATKGAITQTLSSVTALDPFTNHLAPFPIITSIGDNFPKACLPNNTATQYEFSPYWFGSWDAGVAAFTPTKYLGTTVNGGNATKGCTTNYDNIGYVLGTSSSLFNTICSDEQRAKSSIEKDFFKLWQKLKHGTIENRDYYATYPNPFRGMGQNSGLVTGYNELTLADGGETEQNNPIWPLLHRDDISFIIVNDNSADTSNHWVSGAEIYQTYVQAQAVGLTSMPAVPPVLNTSQTMLKSPQFFGCHNSSEKTILYLPNNQWLPQSQIQANQSTYTEKYAPKDTDSMIENGRQTATQGGDEAWPLCVACAMMKNFQNFAGSLANSCQSCFQKYCYNPPGTTTVSSQQ